MGRKKTPEVGKEVLAQCKKCKSDTAHKITVVKGDVIKKVICNACQGEHIYKAPLTEAEKKAKAAKPKKPAARRGRKKDWNSLMAKVEEGEIVDYDLNADYTEIAAIRHKQFGVGVITKILAENKIEVVFQEDKKVLAQNWFD